LFFISNTLTCVMVIYFQQPPPSPAEQCCPCELWLCSHRQSQLHPTSLFTFSILESYEHSQLVNTYIFLFLLFLYIDVSFFFNFLIFFYLPQSLLGK
jgi:hypothetical protein